MSKILVWVALLLRQFLSPAKFYKRALGVSNGRFVLQIDLFNSVCVCVCAHRRHESELRPANARPVIGFPSAQRSFSPKTSHASPSSPTLLRSSLQTMYIFQTHPISCPATLTSSSTAAFRQIPRAVLQSRYLFPLFLGSFPEVLAAQIQTSLQICFN